MENLKTKKTGRITSGLAKVKKWRAKKRLETQEAKLEKLIKNLAERGEVNQRFFDFVRDFIDNNRKPEFWRKVLDRENLSPFQLYDISMVANDEALKTLAQKRFLKEENIENLCEALERTDNDYQEKIFEEICARIKYKLIKKNKAWELLGEIIKNRHISPKYRERSWELLQYQAPPDDVLKGLIDVSISTSDPVLPGLQKKIEIFIRERSKKEKKNFNNTLFNEIKTTIEKIAQLKQVQKLG